MSQITRQNSNYSLLDYRIALNTNLNEKNKFNFTDLNIAQLKQDFIELSNELDIFKLNEILKSSFRLFDSEKTNEIDINKWRASNRRQFSKWI